MSKLFKIWSWDPGSGSRNKPIPDPGSRGQRGTGSRIGIHNTGRFRLVFFYCISVGTTAVLSLTVDKVIHSLFQHLPCHGTGAGRRAATAALQVRSNTPHGPRPPQVRFFFGPRKELGKEGGGELPVLLTFTYYKKITLQGGGGGVLRLKGKYFT